MDHRGMQDHKSSELRPVELTVLNDVDSQNHTDPVQKDSHPSPTSKHETHFNRLWVVICLVAAYCLAEVLGGLWTGSLALLADAAHMASDLAALSASLLAAWLMQRPPQEHRTFGYARAEAIAALFNGGLLFIVAIGVVWEAWHRFVSPNEILGLPMLAIAAGGLVVNLVSLQVLHQHKDENLNLRGAWLHVMGDTLGSVAVIVAAVLIWAFDSHWADPVASLLACLIILNSAWRLLIEAIHILMENAPATIQVDVVRADLLAQTGVTGVHCLHIWSLSSQVISLTAHVVIDENHSTTEMLNHLTNHLREKFGILHLVLQLEHTGTCQIEHGAHDCMPLHTQSHSHSGCSHSH